ncbi:MAG: hypothetical protein ACYC3L_01365 [Gemmatimonadaceae bacterium]
MAGTTTTSKQTQKIGADVGQLVVQHNTLVDDVEAVRAAQRILCHYEVDPGTAGTDVTARAIFVAPAALTIIDSVKVIATEATVGVDVGNTLILTLRNITEGVDVATVTRSATNSANDVIALTLTAANADIASGDVLGVTVTQGATADAGRLMFQFEYQRQTVDAAADLTAAKIGDLAGTAFTSTTY